MRHFQHYETVFMNLLDNDNESIPNYNNIIDWDISRLIFYDLKL
jgi:hypothetical protein